MNEKLDQWYQARLISYSEIDAEHGDYVSLGTEARVMVIDRVRSQLDELAELMHDCPDSLLEEETVWAYYPWRRTLVRVLGENGFKRLRSDRNRNKITGPEQAELAERTIAVVGLSVGHAVAYALAQEGLCGCLRLFDHDELSLSNLNRIPADVFDLALPKTIILARRIAEIDPYFKLELQGSGLLDANLEQAFQGVDMIIDECDSIDMKFAMRFYAQKHRLPVLMQTSDGGVLDVERFDLEPDRPVFHGLAAVDDLDQLKGLSNADKVPLVMGILEADKVSARLAGSLIEIDQQISTWPQLASDIAFGAGMVGAAVRRWGLGQALPSGRLRLDMDHALVSISSPTPTAPLAVQTPVNPHAANNDEELLRAACRAPSGGNVQPWRFSVQGNRFELFLDPSRSSLMDIKQRGSLLALGAALFNVQAQAAAQGRGSTMAELNTRLGRAQHEGREAAAVIEFAGAPDKSLSSLATQISKRACARLRGPSAPIDDAWRARATRYALDNNCQALFLQGEALAHAADIWAEADRIRFLTPKLHREMMSELSFPGDDIRRGIDIRTLELSEKDQVALQIARRADAMQAVASWDGGKRLGEGSGKLITDADAMLVLTCAGHADADYLNAGSLVQRIWLEATRDKVGLHPMSPLFLYATSPSDLVGRLSPDNVKKMWSLRERFAKLCGFAPEQAVALTLRATSKVKFTVRSEREHWKTRLHPSMSKAERPMADLS